MALVSGALLAIGGLTWRVDRAGRAAARLAGEHDALRRSEERFRAPVQNSSDVILIHGADGTLRYASPAFARALRHPDDAASFRRTFARAIDTPGIGLAAEFRARHRNGSWRHLDSLLINLLAEPSVGGIVANARDITERKEAGARLEHQAFHDALTGLPNRTLFMGRLARALAGEHGEQVSVIVLFLDLDGFKLVNDGFGHEAGDQLLIAIGQRPAGLANPDETVARFGGDEFAVLSLRAAGRDEVARLVERLIALLRPPFVIDGREADVNASIGVALGAPGAVSQRDLLREADTALYRAKIAGRDTFAVFEPDMGAPVMAQLERRTAMRQAAERGELRLRYRPIVELGTGRVVGVEALTRWAHPDHGELPPAEFIHLAEETG